MPERVNRVVDVALPEACPHCGESNAERAAVCWACGKPLQGPIVGTCPLCESSMRGITSENVTLSACDSGLGKFSGGDGYLGFSQALFLAGARGLVVSLWQVDDAATALLMTRFYENLLGTPEATAFAARVRDFSEWVESQDALPVRPTGRTVVVQDPCHLRHVQKAAGAVRAVLAPAYATVDTDDDGLCCGAGGAYNVLQPELAADIRDRKVAAIRRAGGGADPLVASANPGCAMHLAAAGLDVRHPADLLAEALDA